jgi:hypothetical protein
MEIYLPQLLMKKIIIILSLFFLVPGVIFAHEPRIPQSNETTVLDPEISKAYYSELRWSPQTYTIDSDIPFSLYVNILVPDILLQRKDISVKIIKNWNIEKSFAILDGNSFAWTKLEEPFGYDTYQVWPEYRWYVEAGRYEIIVSNTDNDGKYALAIGETELFDLKEIRNALYLVPKIKRDFFDESPITFIFSPFGSGLISVMFVIAFIFGFLYRITMRNIPTHIFPDIHRNIGKKARLFLLLVWSLLLILAITTSWSSVLLFFSGLAFFEAIFGWS